MTPGELLLAMAAEATGEELTTMVAIATGDDIHLRMCRPDEDVVHVIATIPRPGPEIIGVRTTSTCTDPTHEAGAKTTLTICMSIDDQLTQITWSDTGEVKLIDERPTGRIADVIDWSLTKTVLP